MPESVPAAPENEGQSNGNSESQEEATDVELSIIRQMEYYFGDANLPRDKFLREQMKLDEGWVPLDVMTRFNRLAKWSTDVEVIAKALNKATSGLLEVSEDNKKVRRNPEMPVPEMNEETRLERLSRTVYAKGFPKDAALDDLLKFFKEQGEVENVIMRRYVDRATKNKPFKGSVFATFKEKEQADKFVANTGLKYGETELIRLWQDEYLKKKQEEYLERKEKKEKGKKDKDENAKEEVKDDFKLPTGTVLKFTGTHNKASREDIKEALTTYGEEIAFIDFKQGDSEGWVRYTKEGAAKEVIAKVEGKIKVGESEVEFTLLEGDDEKAYLDKTIEEMSKRRKNMKNNRFKGNKNRGRQQYGRKRRQDNSDGAPPSKVKA